MMIAGQYAKVLADKANYVEPRQPPDELFERIIKAAKQGQYDVGVDDLPKEEAAWMEQNGYSITRVESFMGGIPDRVVKITWA